MPRVRGGAGSHGQGELGEHEKLSAYMSDDGVWFDQFGQVIDVPLTEQRDTGAARRFFTLPRRVGARNSAAPLTWASS